MQKVTVHVAKTQLSKLIKAALAGEDVVIAKGDKPRCSPRQRFRRANSSLAYTETLTR